MEQDLTGDTDQVNFARPDLIQREAEISLNFKFELSTNDRIVGRLINDWLGRQLYLSVHTFSRFPLRLRAGNYNGSTFYNGGTNGNYWSATASSGTNAHNLNFNSGNVYSANNNNRRNGFSVRCLFAG